MKICNINYFRVVRSAERLVHLKYSEQRFKHLVEVNHTKREITFTTKWSR